MIIIETVVSAVFSCGGFELWSWLLLQFVPFRGSALCVYCGATGEGNPGGESVVVRFHSVSSLSDSTIGT